MNPAARRRAVVLGAAGLLAVAAVWRLGGGPAAQVLAPAPPFELADIAGKKVSLADFRGRTVLLCFWATWCDACRTELPLLQAVHDRHAGPRFALLALSVDKKGSGGVAAFAARHRLTFPILISDDRTQQAYGVYGLPASFVVGADGRLLRRYSGPVDLKALEGAIASAPGSP